MASMRVRRADTSANSAATKNAFATTRTTTARNRRPIEPGCDSCISLKRNIERTLPRGIPVIRRIVVPPFEAVESFLSPAGGADPDTRQAVSGILEAVSVRGDLAVREYTLRFDGVDLEPSQWELAATAWHDALERIAPALR